MPEKTNQDADINKISNTSIKESKMVTMNLERLEPCKTKISKTSGSQCTSKKSLRAGEQCNIEHADEIRLIQGQLM